MLSEDGADGMGCGTAAYEKTSRGRPQSIHSSYIFNLYTMILSPNQTRPDQTRPARNLVAGWCQPKKSINEVAIMEAGVLGA